MTTGGPGLLLDDAAATPWDVVVVGAGCAGALAAREVARRGRSVLLVDRAAFPRYKVCGCCINARAQAALRSVGLGGLLAVNGAQPLHTFHLAAYERRAHLPLPEYAALSREKLDSALVEAAVEAGARFLPRTLATNGTVSDGHRTLCLQQGNAARTVTARLVIAADGLGGRLFRSTDGFDAPSVEGSRIGAGAMAAEGPSYYEPGVIHMACGDGGYVGLQRVEAGQFNIAAAFDTRFVRQSGGLAEAASAVIRQAGFPEVPGLASLNWRGTPALTRAANRLSAHRGLVVGDAAGYIEPFTGEGMAWAMTSAIAVADLASRAVERFDASVEQEWAQRYRRVVTRRQTACRIASGVLRRPRLVHTVIQAICLAPALAVPVIRHVNAPPTSHKGVQHP